MTVRDGQRSTLAHLEQYRHYLLDLLLRGPQASLLLGLLLKAPEERIEGMPNLPEFMVLLHRYPRGHIPRCDLPVGFQNLRNSFFEADVLLRDRACLPAQC